MAAATSDVTAMTPSLLAQEWRSYGQSGPVPVTVFSQPVRPLHSFSNYAHHPPLAMDLPPCCRPTALARAGRSPRLTFRFAEKAIMACKAALCGDYRAFDAIMASRDSRAAKALGRTVAPFDQRDWDAHQCAIVRHVCLAKLAWREYRAALLRTGTAVIAECTHGDWVWGTALPGHAADVGYPGRWRGGNVLGWSLMEARGEAVRTLQQQQQQQQQQQKFAVMPSAPPMAVDVASARSSAPPAPSAPSSTSRDDKANPNSIKYLASQYTFGPKAFGPLQQSVPAQKTPHPDLSHSVKSIVEAAFPAATHMYGQRSNKPVTRMLADIYNQGLFMHGKAASAVNRTIIPAFRLVVAELNKMEATDGKRVAMTRILAEACQDCQQVQARVILRLYGDVTSQHRTFDSQLKYALVQPKEAAIHGFISRHHAPACDQDHTRVEPGHQRAHLVSGYVSMIGDAFGVDGVGAAHGDRFLRECLGVIRAVHDNPERRASQDKNAEQKELIIQRLVQSELEVASSKYERALRRRLTTAHKREISMYVHERIDKDVIPVLFPDLPPPFTASEFRNLAGAQHTCRKQKKSGVAGFLFGQNNPQGGTLDDETLQQFFLHELSQSLCVQEWLAGLLGDINNQAVDADRMIDRACIFAWAAANMDGPFKHRIFYDEERREEYSDLDPARPTEDNRYEPFLSPVVLTEMLVRAGMLERK